jgi:hypothetical protein
MGYPNFKKLTMKVANCLHVETKLSIPSAATEEAGCTTLEMLTFTKKRLLLFLFQDD